MWSSTRRQNNEAAPGAHLTLSAAAGTAPSGQANSHRVNLGSQCVG
jgi:hypothetical protein